MPRSWGPTTPTERGNGSGEGGRTGSRDVTLASLGVSVSPSVSPRLPAGAGGTPRGRKQSAARPAGGRRTRARRGGGAGRSRSGSGSPDQVEAKGAAARQDRLPPRLSSSLTAAVGFEPASQSLPLLKRHLAPKAAGSSPVTSPTSGHRARRPLPPRTAPHRTPPGAGGSGPLLPASCALAPGTPTHPLTPTQTPPPGEAGPFLHAIP